LILIYIHSCDWNHCCAIKASNWEFGDPCWGTHKYLDVTYKCIAIPERSNEIYSVTCEGSVAHLTCGYGRVLNIHWADYGRSDRTTCTATRPSYQTQDTCCSLPMSGRVGRRCDGRRSCSISASNSEFGDPCWGTYKYLEVTYTCDSP
uniref:L-rhamnose-binding lectin CSL3-like n=1 Tax=Acanthochromis polyacanthus TaxID=80966 RepID=A0A3Q1EJR5_9TELE